MSFFGIFLICFPINPIVSPLLIDTQISSRLLSGPSKLYLKDTYPEPKTHEFIVISKYNQIIDSIVEEFVRGEIMKIV